MEEGVVIFVTMFLSLTAGVHPVEVEVTGPAARVEIVLDGVTVRQLQSAPWRTSCDFGRELAPHVLEAIAFDAENREIGRAEQLVNLPRPRADCALALEHGEAEGQRFARLLCRSFLGSPPQRVRVTLDDVELEVKEPERIPLPSTADGSYHFLSAEAVFPEGVTAEAHLSFGGALHSEVRSELTAVPIVVEGVHDPTPAELAGLFLARGQQLRVAAVEHGDATLLVVADPRVRASVARFEEQGGAASVEESKRAESGLRAYGETLRKLKIGESVTGDRVLVVGPVPMEGVTTDALQLFPISGPVPLSRYAVRWLLSNGGPHGRSSPPPDRSGHDQRQRLADALAVAANRAASGSGPRAVLLVVEPDPADHSAHAPQAMRNYPSRLNVPLVVWCTGEPDSCKTTWREAQVIPDTTALQRALDSLLDELSRQRIVWLEGSHLPHDVSLSPAARGLRIAR